MQTKNNNGLEAQIREAMTAPPEALPAIVENMVKNAVTETCFDSVKRIVTQFSPGHAGAILVSLIVDRAMEGVCDAFDYQCLDYLSALPSHHLFSFNRSDELYYLCQIDDNLAIFERLYRLNTDIDWAYVLEISASFAAEELVAFILASESFSRAQIDQAFSALVHSGDAAGSDEQRRLIARFIRDLGADVNLKSDRDYGWLYFVCLTFAPNAAHYFYTDAFDPEILLDVSFWQTFIPGKLEHPRRSKRYRNAFRELVNSGLALDDLRALFDELGKGGLATELLS